MKGSGVAVKFFNIFAGLLVIAFVFLKLYFDVEESPEHDGTFLDLPPQFPSLSEDALNQNADKRNLLEKDIFLCQICSLQVCIKMDF